MYDIETKGEMSADVLEEDERWLHLFDDAEDVWPEMTRVFPAPTLARTREWGAWISGSEQMNLATPRFAVEGLDIVP